MIDFQCHDQPHMCSYLPRICIYIYLQLLGSLPAIFIIETIMEHIGETLGIPSETVKQKNLYEKGQVSHDNKLFIFIWNIIIRVK